VIIVLTGVLDVIPARDDRSQERSHSAWVKIQAK
jgi:hypothetical protein